MRALSRFAVVGAAVVVVAGCGGGDDAVEEAKIPLTVPRATCATGDVSEPALQGQVPAAMRAAGFKGFNCNLKVVSNFRGEGASWQHASFSDKAGRRCNYYDTASSIGGTANRQHMGTVVLDTTDLSNPKPTAYLTTAAMMDPWESLKVNDRRQLLAAVNGTNAAGGPEMDIYDISGDCSQPQLRASVSIGTANNGDSALLPAGQILKGHEGEFSPDGLTYYGGDRGTPKKYIAVDLTDTRSPKLMANWALPQLDPRAVTTHGLSISDDGNRAYVSQAQIPVAADVANNLAPLNGVVILDVSEVQGRKANPQIKQVSSFTWKDGGQIQHTIPLTVKGKRYLVAVDESGSVGSDRATACKAGLPPFAMARIIDINDEKQPKLASRLMLEIHDPANCDAVIPDIVGLTAFHYGSHYCSVDNRSDATTLACSYPNSGIRVFDIRDPVRPKEIAYFNPAGVTTPSYGSNHFSPNAFPPSGSTAGNADICTAQVRLDAATGTLQTTCQDNGFMTLKFESGVWPFADSSTPPGKQN